MVQRNPLAGKIAIVTGASSGIGYATALRAASLGCQVVAVGRRADRLEELRRTAPDGRVRVACGDITEAAFRKRIAALEPAANILVNAAGILQHTPFMDGDPAAWELMWKTNVHALLTLTQEVSRGMQERHNGHIINVTSVLVSRPFQFTLAYAATKAAVRAITEGLRIELGPLGIRVTEVAPGLTRTEILRDVVHPAVLETYQRRAFEPLSADDVAAAIIAAVTADPNARIDRIEMTALRQA